MGGGGNTTSNTVSEFKPPAMTQPYWADYMSAVANAAAQPAQTYNGQTVAEWNGTQDAAAGLTAEQALHGAPDENAARASNMATSQGAYLNNPYANDDYTNTQIANTAGNMATAYATGTAADQARNAQMAGAFGGGGDQAAQAANAAALNKSVGDMAAQYRLSNQANQTGDYRTATGQMLNANAQGATYNAADNANAAALMNVGNAQNSYEQALLNQQYGNWQTQNNAPLAALGLMQQGLQAASGSGGTTIGSASQNQTPSWVTGGLGGAAGILGLLGNKI
jgi:hypothetical protein